VTLTLAIEASTATFAVLLGEAGRILAHREAERDASGRPSLPDLAASVLDAAGARFEDIGLIGLDVGPGNLAAVRGAVAYANGLAFSLGIGISQASSLELMAMAAGRDDPSPVLCARNAGSGNIYAGLFCASTAPDLRHGPLPDAVTAMAAGLAELRVAGDFTCEIAAELCGCAVSDTKVTRPDVFTLYELTAGQPDPARLVAAASPLNEGSPVFHPGADGRRGG
jgi:tRNA threonylcarbamoyladenosine biosynthesis protein TsaB